MTPHSPKQRETGRAPTILGAAGTGRPRSTRFTLIDVSENNMLGDYLRARRELVQPDSVGLPAGGVRRVAGLRREEVAMLAGISSDYYLRLEQGRDRNPSIQVLEALARVLRLDQAATDYLLGLATPLPRHRRRRLRREIVPASIRQLLDVLGLPAFVEGRYFDVLAANSLAYALSPTCKRGRTDSARYFSIPQSRRCTRISWRTCWIRSRRSRAEGCSSWQIPEIASSRPSPPVISPQWLPMGTGPGRHGGGPERRRLRRRAAHSAVHHQLPPVVSGRAQADRPGRSTTAARNVPLITGLSLPLSGPTPSSRTGRRA